MSEENSVIAVYKTHVEAEEAVKQLQRAGTDMHKLSVVGKDTHADEQVVGYYNAGDRMKYWGKTGAFWGGFWDCCLDPHFSPFPVSVRYWLPVRWLRGSWEQSKARFWWVDLVPSAPAFTVLAFRRTPLFNMNSRSKRISFYYWCTALPRKSKKQERFLRAHSLST